MTATAEPRAGRRVGVGRPLALAALAVVATHWLRLLPLGFLAPGATRWEDFADLLTPYLVAGPALLVLARTGASRGVWALALLAAAVFVQGHGLHLSANSITFATGEADPAYLWDEQVGHHLWFAGLTLLTVVVGRQAAPHVRSTGPLAAGLALLVGLTWAANVVEGGVVPFGSALAVLLLAEGVRARRTALGRLLALAFAVALLVTGGYGLVQDGFPQPSELGWL